MTCKNCGSKRLMAVNAKCSDLCNIQPPHDEGDYTNGYVPDGLNIGGGDYVEFEVCLDCGTIQGVWPITPEAVAVACPMGEEEEDDDDE